MSRAALAHAVNGFFDAFKSKSSPHVAAQPASRASGVMVESRYNEGDDESLLESATSLPRPTLKALEKSIRADGFRGAQVSGWGQGQRGGFTVHYDGQPYEFEISENVTPRPTGEIGRLVKESGRYGRNGRRTGILSDGTRINVYYSDKETGEPWTAVPHGMDWDAQARGDMRAMLGMSERATGVSQFTEGMEGRHLGRSVPWDAVPADIKRHIESLLVSEGSMVANGSMDALQEDDYIVGNVDRDTNIGLFRVIRGGKWLGPIEKSANFDTITHAMESDARGRGTHAAAVFEMQDNGGVTQVGNVVRGRYVESGDYSPNARGTVVDPNAASELDLYIANTYELVAAPNSPGKSIDTSLKRKLAAGKYDSALAPKAWQYLVDEGAKRYAREIGPEPTFNAATRRQVAADFARAWEEENQLARNPSDMNAYQDQAAFIEELQRGFDPEAADRQIFYRTRAGALHVTYVNLPRGVGSAGGGAEAQNNRMSFDVDGFSGGSRRDGRVKIEQSTSFADRSRNLRAKTGAPAAIARYLAAYLAKFAAEVPPRFTHTRT